LRMRSMTCARRVVSATVRTRVGTPETEVATTLRVHGIRIEPQPKQGTGYYFVIRSDDADALKSLNEAKTAYPNSALSRVGCQTTSR